jgi:inward rectifier potassium channel
VTSADAAESRRWDDERSDLYTRRAMNSADKLTPPPRPRPTVPAVRVVGVRRTPFRDFYHLFLRAHWTGALGTIVAVDLVLNGLFALAYLVTGGIANARPGSFTDAFYFSVQTLGTLGYGAMYPVSQAANLVVVVESMTGLLGTALATGLVFAKFSHSAARIAFTRHVVIGPMDGVPTLMLRVGNERGNSIVEATARVSMVRTEKTKEGSTFYRLYELRLARERSQAVNRSWTILHSIVEGSPLFGATPESLARDEVELMVSLAGIDDTSMQPVHAAHRYSDAEILWGARHADVLSEASDGTLVLDIGKFHDVVPTERTADFPYPR